MLTYSSTTAALVTVQGTQDAEGVVHIELHLLLLARTSGLRGTILGRAWWLALASGQPDSAEFRSVRHKQRTQLLPPNKTNATADGLPPGYRPQGHLINK